jgi:hypothetical protein
VGHKLSRQRVFGGLSWRAAAIPAFAIVTASDAIKFLAAICGQQHASSDLKALKT